MRPGYLGDVTHRKRGLRFEKKQSWVPASEEEGWLSELGEARRLCALRAPRVGWVESWRCKSSQHRKIVSLPPHVGKPLNSKRWIKVSYLNQFREYRVFRDSYILYIWVWRFNGRFTYPFHGYVTSNQPSISLINFLNFIMTTLCSSVIIIIVHKHTNYYCNPFIIFITYVPPKRTIVYIISKQHFTNLLLLLYPSAIPFLKYYTNIVQYYIAIQYTITYTHCDSGLP